MIKIKIRRRHKRQPDFLAYERKFLIRGRTDSCGNGGVAMEMTVLKELAKDVGSEIYIVGGAVRNRLLGLSGGTDVDICGNIDPETIRERLGMDYAAAEINRRLGTLVILHRASGQRFEYTAFRQERYEGGRHVPHAVTFTDDICEDAVRRDFTVNAVYQNVTTGEIVDPTGGVADVKLRILRTVTRPEVVFGVDGLRIMRLARISAQLGFSIDEATLLAASELSYKLADISAERICAELKLILSADEKYDVADAQYNGLKTLVKTGAMTYVIPEILAGDGMAQRSDFHRYDVLEHTLQAVRFAPRDVRLAALFHDIAKAPLKISTGKMFGHDREGARMTREILSRLRFSNDEISETARLVDLHMTDIDGRMANKKVRIVIQQNQDIFEKLMQLKQADYLATGLKSGICPTTVKWRRLYSEMKEKGVPFSTGQLQIRAVELIDAFHLSGSRIGDMLSYLLKRCAVYGKNLTRQELISEADGFLKTQREAQSDQN